ncbi:MAG: alkene reductase [Microcoleus sp.]
MTFQSISPQLLSPFMLGDLPLKNRVVMAPLTRSRAGVERIANALMAEYYAQRASAGLIIGEATTISEQANGWVNSPGIYSDEQTMGWKQVVDAIHAKGGHIFLQLWHTGRASHSSFHNGQLPVAPSAIRISAYEIHTPSGKQPHEIPRILETEEIPGIVEDFRKAAERSQAAGFDGVEIHAANGYLIDQFLQSKTNHRSDRYGGSLENRFRFLQEIVEAVLTVWPANRVGVRISPNGVDGEMGSPDFRETFLYVAKQLNIYNLSYLHVIDGDTSGFHALEDIGFHGLGEPMTLAEFRSVFTGVLIGNSGYTQKTAEKAIQADYGYMIAFGRLYISNPDLVERFTHNLELNPMADPSTWYTFGAEGYTDFPTYAAVSLSS